MDKTISLPVLGMVLAGAAAFYDLKTDVALLKQKLELAETRTRVATALGSGDISAASRVIAQSAPVLEPAEIRAMTKTVTTAETRRNHELVAARQQQQTLVSLNARLQQQERTIELPEISVPPQRRRPQYMAAPPPEPRELR